MLTSCNKWFDVNPRQEVLRDELYSSEKGFRNALIGIYVKLAETYPEDVIMSIPDRLAQLWIASDRGNEMEKALMAYEYGNPEVELKLKDIYKNIFNTIAQTNDFLTYMDKNGADYIKDQQMFDMMKGEALAIRALCHFDVLRIWGEVPGGVKKISLPYKEEGSNSNAPYYDFNTFIGKVLKDYSDAEALLKKSDFIIRFSFNELDDPDKIASNPETQDDFVAYRRYRLNYYAVKALQARAYLYKGDADSKSKAYQHCMDIIKAKVENTTSNDNNKTVIDFEKLSSDITNKFYSLPSETLFQLNVTGLSDLYKSLFNTTVSKNHLHSVEGRSKEGRVLETIFGSEVSDIRYKDIWFSTGGYTKSFTVRKYYQDENSRNTESVVPIIRLSEVYLIAAETTLDLQEANTLFDTYTKYKGRRSLGTISKDKLDEAILKEYLREFWAEGQIWFTYKRRKENKTIWRVNTDVQLELTEREYLIPLPSTEYQP